MTRTLIVSDANILIDIEVSGLTQNVFALDIDLAVPDLLFYEEIAPFNPTLKESDLVVIAFDEETNSLLFEKANYYVIPHCHEMIFQQWYSL